MQRMQARAAAAEPNHFRWSVIISSLLVLPFMILESVNARAFPGFPQSFPIPLFAMLWLLAFSFVHILTRMMRGESTRVRRVPPLAARLLGIVVLIFIAYAWVGIVVDQMPCFLGRPNCD